MAKFNSKQLRSMYTRKEVGRHAVGGGLYFRISASGTASWEVRYTLNNSRKFYTLTAGYPELSLADASIEAAAVKRLVRQGVDPVTNRQREKMIRIKSVTDLFNAYLDKIQSEIKEPHRTKRLYEMSVLPYMGDSSIEGITARDVESLINNVIAKGHKAKANKLLSLLKKMFAYAVKLDLLPASPAAVFTTRDAGGRPAQRNVHLTLGEISQLFKAMNSDELFTKSNKLAVALIIVLGSRKMELIGAPWSEFDLDNGLWHLPAKRNKTKEAITYPLPSQCVTWLRELHFLAADSHYVFPKRMAYSKTPHISERTLLTAIQTLQERHGLKVTTVHDLRRSCRTLLSSIGTTNDTAERMLNHKMDKIRGTYDHYDYLDERAVEHAKIAAMIQPMVDSISNVTTLETVRRGGGI
ncbi:tyrosine-type recombinase/integrase [Photobacterium sp. DA100]|uniref:tyrosine-type recombinase/integrase n=1 Tax=Photobacterium sp. DA100 TaxID=3027472 RepID=UPI00247AA78A|nr:site-specific integrase [Photobacterium sp. DA100]WEM42253.1 tyrosine-type recombinase/integrase [Photobacterium sp. DA100]